MAGTATAPGPGRMTPWSANDTYSIRFYDTTYIIPRFNNQGTQVTVLVIQNTKPYTVNGIVYLWVAAGTPPAGSTTFAIPAHGVFVVNTATITGGSVARPAR